LHNFIFIIQARRLNDHKVLSSSKKLLLVSEKSRCVTLTLISLQFPEFPAPRSYNVLPKGKSQINCHGRTIKPCIINKITTKVLVYFTVLCCSPFIQLQNTIFIFIFLSANVNCLGCYSINRKSSVTNKYNFGLIRVRSNKSHCNKKTSAVVLRQNPGTEVLSGLFKIMLSPDIFTSLFYIIFPA